MKLRVIFTFVALVISFSLLTGCFGGGGSDDYYPAVDDSIPTVVSKTTTDDISDTTVQVTKAVEESVASVDLPTAMRADVRASEAPTFVPGMGNNTLLSPSKMMSLLAVALPTGGNVNGGFGMENNNTKQIATYTAATKVLEVTNIATDHTFNGTIWVTTDYVQSVAKFTGVDAVVTDNMLVEATIGAGATLEMKEYDKAGNLVSTILITIESGLSAASEYTMQTLDAPVFVPTFSNVFGEAGQNRYKVGTETTELTFTSPFEVTVSLTEGGKTSTGSIKFTGMTGKYTITDSISIYKYASKPTGGDVTESISDVFYKGSFGESKGTNALAFANNQLQLNIAADWANEGVIIDSFSLTLPMQTTTTNFAHGMNYKVVGATGEMQARYTGTEAEKYGYIKSLVVNLSAVNYDPTKDMVDDGALFTVKQTARTPEAISDTVTTLEYKIVAGKPVLQAGKGNEVIVVDDSGNVTAKGNVQYTKTGEANALTIAYERTKSDTGEITARVEVTFGTNSMTLFFSLENDKTIADGEIIDGITTTKQGKTKRGTFTRNIEKKITVTLSN